MSKIDEAVVHGNIINLSAKTGSPIAFLTMGKQFLMILFQLIKITLQI
jgi:flagellar biosynthesis GTPase FlhF